MAISELAFTHFISKYREEYCMQLLDHCSEGRSIESFAAKINNIPEAMAYWANSHPEFEVCLRVAYWKSFYWWENKLIEDQEHINEFKTLSPKLFEAVMKNRYRWRDTADDLMLALGRMSDKELEDRARKILLAREDRPTTIDMKEERFIKKRTKNE